MPHLLAIEWDETEARVAVADVRRDSVVLEQAFSVSIPSGPPAAGSGGTEISASGAHDLGAIGRRINEALVARGVRRGKTLVAVGRANIELKNLTMPPAPPEELPELVRFQAEREFNTLDDDWPLDFIPLPSEPGEPLTVLAAAISPELVGEIEVTCRAANLSPQRLVLRPCAAASLLCRAKPGSEQKLRLLVDVLSEEADLTVLAGDAVVFMRTARLHSEALQSEPLKTLLPEIRRTIAAVHNRYHGQHVAEVFLCGELTNQGSLAREIGRELGVATEVFNPLTCCTLGGELQRQLPEHPSRFAPLVGMLLDEADPGIGTIDFLNPRRKPKAPTRRKEWIIAGAAAALLVLIGVLWVWFQIGSLDSEIAGLTRKLSDLGTEKEKRDKDKPVQKSQEMIRQAKEIDKWLAGDVKWLDEFARLAAKIPGQQQLLVTQLTTSENIVQGTSTLSMNALASEHGVAAGLHETLRDEKHEVSQKGVSQVEATRQAQDAARKRYTWVADADILIKPAAAVPAAGAKKAGSGAAAASPPAASDKAAPEAPAPSTPSTVAAPTPTTKSATEVKPQ